MVMGEDNFSVNDDDDHVVNILVTVTLATLIARRDNNFALSILTTIALAIPKAKRDES